MVGGRKTGCEGEGNKLEDHQGASISICKNDVPHEGELILTKSEGETGEGIYRLLPGVALRMFDASMLLQVRGENVLYVNVADKGTVTVTGCGHPGIMNLLSFAKDNLAAPGLYGCYGGLHLSIFDTWKPRPPRHSWLPRLRRQNVTLSPLPRKA